MVNSIREIPTARILREISRHKDGISAYKLSKTLNVIRQSLEYKLSNLEKLGIIKKENSKYRLVKKAMIYEGKVLIEGDENFPFIIIDCPYYPCKENCKLDKDCRLIKELPDFMVKKLKKHLGIE